MTGQTIAFLKALLEQIGAAYLSSGNLIIIAIEIDYDLFGDRQARQPGSPGRAER